MQPFRIAALALVIAHYVLESAPAALPLLLTRRDRVAVYRIFQIAPGARHLARREGVQVAPATHVDQRVQHDHLGPRCLANTL